MTAATLGTNNCAQGHVRAPVRRTGYFCVVYRGMAPCRRRETRCADSACLRDVRPQFPRQPHCVRADDRPQSMQVGLVAAGLQAADADRAGRRVVGRRLASRCSGGLKFCCAGAQTSCFIELARMRNCLLNHPTADGSYMCSSRLLEDYLLPFGHGLAHLSCDRVPQPARLAQLPILENEMTDRAVRGRDMIEAVLYPRRLAA